MLNSILEFIIKLILYIASFIINIILTPIFAFIDSSGLVPDLTEYLDSFAYFVDNYLIRGLAFAREVFLNVTGFPRSLLHALVLLYLGKLAFHIFVRTYKFISNIYHYIRGSGGEMVD